MKKLLLFIALLATGSGYTQDFCTTPANSEHKELVLETYRDLDVSMYKFCVRIYIHVVRRDNGTGGQTVGNVNDALGYLDDAFNPYDIYFWWNNTINYIDNTTFFDTPGLLMPIDTYDHTDGVDIYLFDDSYTHPITGNGFGLASGIGEEPAKLLVAGSWNTGLVTIPLARSHVLSHEMGHVLFLYHTHHGTVPEMGDPGQCPECANGSNSAICGDYITDTPADPNMTYSMNVYCEWTGSGYDSCGFTLPGNPYNPDELNIMSYTDPYCMVYFTPKQAARMKKALAVIPHLQDLSSYTLTGDACPDGGPSLLFYPNPVDETLYLDLREKPYDTYTYQLYDLSGNLKLSGQCINELKALDVSGFNPGLHFLHFYEREEVIIKTLIVI